MGGDYSGGDYRDDRSAMHTLFFDALVRQCERDGTGVEVRRLTAGFSKARIDRLGDRLRKGPPTEADLRLLDDYRRSFGGAYNETVRIIRERGQSPTGRSAKSTVSIVEKLRRESIRLSQMQDIAGCRVVVTGIVEQERVVAAFCDSFPGATVIDRRDNPSHGYRAVHVVVTMFGNPIEIQVRTNLQHVWAELSEKASDVLDPAIKYGGGPAAYRRVLEISSACVRAYEAIELAHPTADADLKKELEIARNETAEALNTMISVLNQRNQQR